MLKFLGWLCSVVFAFSLGTSVGTPSETRVDSELKQKVRDHMDVIVDETAAMVDDVVDEIRQNEHVQNAEAFVEDVQEIIENTADDIRAHFGTEEEAAEENEEADDTLDATDAVTADPEETTAPSAGN
ncbi:MAG: hypothetical protein IJ083_14220 [Clostridia bacterium]|nr:hypothetical protein [Clostridia bacterium]